MKLYDDPISGNGYKVRLLFALLNKPYSYERVDIDKGETRTPEFLSLNPNGRIPLLVLDGGDTIAESNAILYYLSNGTEYLPSDGLARAHVLQWMFFEQYSHEPYVAVLRHWLKHLGREEDDEVRSRREKGYDALRVMEGHLASRDYFVGGSYSVADIALFAYTHVAGEGGFDLTHYPAVRAWLERVADQAGHIPMTPVPSS